MDRKSGIGGSDCAAAIGWSDYKTPYQIYLKKIGEDTSNPDNDAMEWGRDLEPLIIKRYSRKTGNEIEFMLDESGNQQMLRSTKYPWMIAHVDGLVKGRPLILEAKSTRFFNNNWGAEETDKMPKEYLLQCAHYCVVVGETRDIEGADLAVLGSTSDFRIYKYRRNEKLEKLIIELTGRFWNDYVLSKTSPPPTVRDDLSKIYSKVIEGTVVASHDDYLLYHELNNIKAEIKKLEETKDKVEHALKLKMQNKNMLINSNGDTLITWNEIKSSRLDQKKLKSSGLDLSPYYIPSSSRKFDLKSEPNSVQQ